MRLRGYANWNKEGWTCLRGDLGLGTVIMCSCHVLGEERTVYPRERPDSVDSYGIGGRVVI